MTKTIRFKDLFQVISKKNTDPNVVLLAATQDRGIIPKNEVGYRTVTISEDNYEGLKVVKKGDFCITLRSFQGGIEYSEHDGGISSGYTVLRFKKKAFDKYFKYFLKNVHFISTLNKYKVSIRDGQNIPFSNLGKENILFLEYEQQTAIANYLDYHTTKIDKEISLLEQKVEKLDEYKQSLIYETVTKGLDKNVPMKDSGIEWIGMIPEHWEVKRVKDVFSTLNKSIISSSDADEDGNYDFYISGAKLKKSNTFNLTKEALLLPTGGSYMVHYPKKLPCAYSTDVLPIVVNKTINLKFAFYLLSHNKSYFNENYFWGSGLKHLQRNAFFNSEIIIASKNEQQQITEYLDEQCSKIDKKKELINKKVELLKEYKQSLIYEAVTGKIDIGEYNE